MHEETRQDFGYFLQIKIISVGNIQRYFDWKCLNIRVKFTSCYASSSLVSKQISLHSCQARKMPKNNVENNPCLVGILKPKKVFRMENKFVDQPEYVIYGLCISHKILKIWRLRLTKKTYEREKKRTVHMMWQWNNKGCWYTSCHFMHETKKHCDCNVYDYNNAFCRILFFFIITFPPKMGKFTIHRLEKA